MQVRTRFAPSPTGYLHVGGARTALFSWLHARHHGGKFILRIEDTDRERSTPESVNAILESMSWLGLDFDEGPFYQTERMDRYWHHIEYLLKANQAYYCYCSKEELEQMREAQRARGAKPRYDGRHRDYTGPPPADAEPVIRFKNPMDGEVVVNDMVRGRVVYDNRELDDLIIARADGTPTYNFTVVVDDMEMGITHVIRGDDHMNNTPRQINILKALDAPTPVYAHVPMIVGSDGQRLSKRHGAVSVTQYRDEGYMPEAMLNYLVRLGWSYGDQEIFSLDEMVDLFDVKDVNKAASAFDPEKCLWLNHHYIKNGNPVHVAHHFGWHLGRSGVDPRDGPDSVEVVMAQRERSKTLQEMVINSTFFYEEFEHFEETASRKHLKADALIPLTVVRDRLRELPEWRGNLIHQVVVDVAEIHGLKLGKVAQPLRVAVCGRAASPPIDITLELVGRGRTLARLERALAWIREASGAS